MDISNIFLEYTHHYDKELNVVQGFASIQAFIGDDFDHPIEIGYIFFHYYNLYQFDSDQSLLLCADSISGDEIFIVHTLIESDFDFIHGQKLITLDRISIEDQYYSADVEEKVLEQFLGYLDYMMFDYVAVIAVKSPPLDKSTPQIIDFPQFKMYEKFNFKLVNKSDKKMPVMVKDLHLIW